MADCLRISPSEVNFEVPKAADDAVTLSLANHGNERIAFKCKTTSAKKYCARPSSGIIEPGTSRDVQVRNSAPDLRPPTTGTVC